MQARHILLRAESADEVAKATATLDSIKTIIEAGAGRFDSLAMKVSQDGSGPKGETLVGLQMEEWSNHLMI